MVKKQIVRLLATVATATMPLLSGGCQSGTPIKVTEVSGSGSGSGSGTENNIPAFCSGFSLSPEQAQMFFDRAEEISPREMHDAYDYLPCYVRGKASYGAQVCEWEVRVGGSGQITCGEKSILMACRDCLPAPP